MKESEMNQYQLVDAIKAIVDAKPQTNTAGAVVVGAVARVIGSLRINQTEAIVEIAKRGAACAWIAWFGGVNVYRDDDDNPTRFEFTYENYETPLTLGDLIDMHASAIGNPTSMTERESCEIKLRQKLTKIKVEDLIAIADQIWDDSPQNDHVAYCRGRAFHKLLDQAYTGAEVTVGDYVNHSYCDHLGMAQLFEVLDRYDDTSDDDVRAIENVFDELRAKFKERFGRPKFTFYDWTPGQSLKMFESWRAQRAIQKVLKALPTSN